MPDQIYIGNFAKGLVNNKTAFNIDNDAFPYLYNFYSWRGRVKKKRGTKLLARLELQVEISSTNPNNYPWIQPAITLSSGSKNLAIALSLSNFYGIAPGSISFTVGANTYTEPAIADGTLIGSPSGTGTINYATGVVSITGGGSSTLTGTFSYYPGLPVMGLRDFVSNSSNSNYPLPLAFDTIKSYQFNETYQTFYNVSYYKKTGNLVAWSAPDSQQFWTTNYESALWATNNNPGFHYVKGISTGVDQTSTTITFTLYYPSTVTPITYLTLNDYLWFNEWVNTSTTINGVTGFISDITGAATGVYIVTFPSSVTVKASDSGIAQLLTNSLASQDGIKWYDGDPTGGTGLPSSPPNEGWVNFAPPLTQYPAVVSINNQTSKVYYLIGALAIVAFKDRLLFFGPTIGASDGTVVTMPLQDTVIWSWNGTPYYSTLVPTNSSSTQTSDASAYYVNQTGKGGWQSAGISQPIQTVANNEDVLIVGFGGTGKKTRFAYTSNDFQPFLFYLINSELPSQSTFSAITLDTGVIDIGEYGLAMTTQQSCKRIDLEIPNQIFQIEASDNDIKRVNAARDFYREWVYFSYTPNTSPYVYPTETLLFNYRDNTWAIFYENFTTHGTYRKSTSSLYTWATIPFPSWSTWNEPWNSAAQSSLFPSVIAGNPQGYVLIVGEDGTSEDTSGYITAIQNNGLGFVQITSNNHCVLGNNTELGYGDYLSFNKSTLIGQVTNVIDDNNFSIDIPYTTTANIIGATKANPCVLTLQFVPPVASPAYNGFFVGQQVSIASVGGMTQLNGNTYTITASTPTTIQLNVNSSSFGIYTSGGTVTLTTYIGLANYTRLCQPFMQTKQFPFYWEQGRKTTLKTQRYLLDYTYDGQITSEIYLSQDNETPWNRGPIEPNQDTTNKSLEYSQIVYTCPESTNLGLTPANTNLQMPTAATQSQIWHRMNTSLIGDTIQIGLTLSDTQMRNLSYATNEITLHGIQLTVDKGPLLS